MCLFASWFPFRFLQVSRERVADEIARINVELESCVNLMGAGFDRSLWLCAVLSERRRNVYE